MYPDRADPARVRVRFDRPLKAVAPGQAAVAYDESRPERVLGGGWIMRRLAAADFNPPTESSPAQTSTC